MMLQKFDTVPDAFFDCAPDQLRSILGGPSLFFLEGRKSPPLFVTIVQHGNEPTGLDAVQRILQKYRSKGLPRSMWLFVANVLAAEKGQRTLDHQIDFNRSWPGTSDRDTAEANLMEEVFVTVTNQPLFASIDIHNNTGSNPHYGCINELGKPFLNLAALFSRTAIYFRQPTGVQSLVMAEHCPAITLECGKAGEQAALRHAVEYLDACLHLHSIPDHEIAKGDLHLLRTHATVKMKPGVSFGFDGRDLDVRFRKDLDHLNFGRLKKGESLAEVKDGLAMPVTASLDDGSDIADQLFEIKNARLVARQDIVPSMATLDIDVIRQDCLFYVMEEMKLEND